MNVCVVQFLSLNCDTNCVARHSFESATSTSIGLAFTARLLLASLCNTVLHVYQFFAHYVTHASAKSRCMETRLLSAAGVVIITKAAIEHNNKINYLSVGGVTLS